MILDVLIAEIILRGHCLVLMHEADVLFRTYTEGLNYVSGQGGRGYDYYLLS
jgi:hypothetical protein